MKKILLVLCLFLLVGCGKVEDKDLECTFNETNEGVSKTTYTITFKFTEGKTSSVMEKTEISYDFEIDAITNYENINPDDKEELMINGNVIYYIIDKTELYGKTYPTRENAKKEFELQKYKCN